MWEKSSVNTGEGVITYLHNGCDGDTTLFIIPGMLSEAESYTSVFDRIDIPVVIPVSCIADDWIDLSFGGQVRRIHLLIESLRIDNCILIGHSVGAALAVMVAHQCEAIKILVMIDYVPVYPKVNDDWLTRALIKNEKNKEAISRLASQSERVGLTDEFSKLLIPVYLLKAELSDYLAEPAIKKMIKLNPRLIVHHLAGCDHDLNGDTETIKILHHLWEG